MMKKTAVSTLLKGLLDRVHRTLFGHMVKSGLILCAVPPSEEGHGADTQAEQQDVQTGDDTGTAAGDDQQASEQGADNEEVVVTIGDEAPPASNEDENQPAPAWVKEVRQQNRELQRQKRELEQKLAEKDQAAAPGAVKVGEKPTLEGCDFDADRFEADLTAWHERKRAADEQATQQRKEQEQAQADWQGKLTAYNTAKAGLKVVDYEDAEAVVLEALNPTQQAIIINGADKPELVVYALGKNPAKAKELASIKDPVKYAFAVAKLETQLKVTPRKAPPPAEKAVRGSAAGTSMDSTLARLEADADRTGDRSKVIAYKREQRRGQA